MNEERIMIPYDTPAGQRCYEVLAQIAMKQLTRARDAVEDFINSLFPVSEFLDEKAMTNGKYTAVYAIPNGANQKVIYDYRTKNIEIIGG